MYYIKRNWVLAAGILCLILAFSPSLQAMAFAGEFGSNRYTQTLEPSEALTGYDLEGYQLLLENDTLALYWRSRVGALRVLDKRSGYVWGTMKEDKPENMNQRWAAIANSMVMIDVYDESGKSYKAGASEENLRCEAKDGSVLMHADWPDWQIRFTFQMELADNGLKFSMEDENLREDGDYRLANVTFLPFFGAVPGNDLPGYVFIPDGCGALIRFLSPRNYLTGYEKRIYGADLGIDAINSLFTGAAATATQEQTVSLPLFGMTHGEGQNAYLAVAENGEEYGVIVAEPAGLISDYTRAHIRFIYRQMYEQPVSRVGMGVQTLQPVRNTVNPVITYYFLTGEDAGYCGMARTYRGLLEERGVLKKEVFSDELPMRVDFLAADIRKEFIGTSVLIATSEEFFQKAGGELREAAGSGLQTGLVGWQKGGLNGYDKSGSVKHTVYGKLSEWKNMEEIWLSLSPFSAREKQLDKRGEGAISLSQELIDKKRIDRTGTQEEWLGDVYYLKPEKALDALTDQRKTLAEEGIGHLLLQDMDLLYGEYLNGSETSRSQAMEEIRQAVAEAASGTEKLVLTRPNAYLFESMDGYDQIPMVSSQFLYETDTVPFLQMVLSGSVELYAPYGNFSFYSASDVLKMIDYNTSPTWLLTEVDNYELRDTASSGLFSTRYQDWKETMIGTYEQVSGVLNRVRGQRLLNRLTPETGVAVNCYENGRIYVNYNDTQRVVDGVELPAQSAVYREGE